MKIGLEGDGEIGKANCFFLLRNSVAIVNKKRGETYKCHVYEKERLENFFTSPCNSKAIDIYYLRKRHHVFRTQYVHVSKLKKKMVALPYGSDGSAIILLKLRHT